MHNLFWLFESYSNIHNDINSDKYKLATNGDALPNMGIPSICFKIPPLNWI